MKVINRLTLIICTVFVFIGCTHNFDEINTNPNKPDRLDQPRLLLGKIIKDLANQDLAANKGSVLGDYLVDQYISMFNDAFNNTSTGSYYYDGRNLQDMINISKEQGFDYMLGIGYILKSFMYQQITDAYGDFPYSEALSGKTDGVFEPKYDTQEEIYKALISQLEEANILLSQQRAEEIGSYDNLFNGDILKWRKFANSLKLRLLMRGSLKIDNAGQKISEMLNQPDIYPLMENIDDNAVFTYSADQQDNWSPLYADRTVDFNGIYMSVTIEGHLKAMNDPRLKVYFCPTMKGVDEGEYIYAGVPNCIRDADEMAYNGGDSYNSRKGYLFVPREFDAKYGSPTAAQCIFLTYSEIMFYLAEAREKGMISTGDAATYYRNGIDASFEYWASRIPSNYIEMKSMVNPPTEVFEASDVIPDESYYEQEKVKYTGTQEQKLEKIGVQKWIALYLCGIEGWSEWRRTGYPKEISVTPPRGLPSASNISEWPRRIPYPQNELVYNNDQYQIAIGRQGEDNLLTRLWWNK